MKSFLRKHWYDLGGVLAIAVFIFLLYKHSSMSRYEILMWVSLITLFLHPERFTNGIYFSEAKSFAERSVSLV